MYSRKRNFADVSTNLFRKRRSRVLQVFIVRDILENESSVEKYLTLFAIEWITHLEKLRGNQRTNSKLKIVERFASGLRIDVSRMFRPPLTSFTLRVYVYFRTRRLFLDLDALLFFL